MSQLSRRELEDARSQAMVTVYGAAQAVCSAPCEGDSPIFAAETKDHWAQPPFVPRKLGQSPRERLQAMFTCETNRREFMRGTAAMIGAGSAAFATGAACGDETIKRERWLVVAAHPDDEAKAAALLFSERKPEDELIVLVMRLTGESGVFGRRDVSREFAIATRSAEMEESARFLDASFRWWLPPHPDAVNIVVTPENVERMVQLLNEIKPSRILTHWEDDPHPDHVGTAKLVEEAVKRLEYPGEKHLYFWGQLGQENKQKGFVPNQFVDISDPSLLARVLWSFFLHRSQASLQYMEKHLKYYQAHGQLAGVEYAAGYMVEAQQ